MSMGPTMHKLIPGEPEEHTPPYMVYPPAPPPELYRTSKGRLAQLRIDEQEIDNLIIQVTRRADTVLADICRLQEKPAKLAHVLMGREGMRKLLLESVDFNAVAEIERAAKRLESLLGDDALIKDARSEMGGGLMAMCAVQELVQSLVSAVQPYRAMRDELK